MGKSLNLCHLQKALAHEGHQSGLSSWSTADTQSTDLNIEIKKVSKIINISFTNNTYARLELYQYFQIEASKPLHCARA